MNTLHGESYGMDWVYPTTPQPAVSEDEETLAETMADAQCVPGESSWYYLTQREKNTWMAAARKAKQIIQDVA